MTGVAGLQGMTNWQIISDLVHLKRGQKHLFFRPKTLAWALVDDLGALILSSTDVAKIIANLARELNASPDEIAKEIQRFFEILRTKGVLAENEPPILSAHADQIKPLSLYMHLTAHCNLSCLYCYNQTQRKGWGADMSLLLAKRILRQAKEMEIATVVLTGGEPLLNPHALEIAELAHELGFRVVLLTNAILIDETVAKRLAQSSDQIVVSLDSIDPAIHDALRGHGTHERAEQAVKYLKDAGAKEVAIAGVITRYNQEESPQDFENYAKEIGADRAVRQIYILQGDQRDLSLLPNFDALLRDMEEALEKAVAQGVEFGNETDTAWRDRCGAAFGEIAIGPDGTVYPCQGLMRPEFQAGSIVLHHLAEIWAKSEILAKIRAITVDDIPRCRACPFRYLCGGGCRALAYTVHHSLTMPIPQEYCAFNRLLAEQKLWLVALRSIRPTQSSY